MRLWSLHPQYLDAKGLVALWREGLLARKVLTGNTEGYRNHPQLIRFRTRGNPIAALDTYLYTVYEEAQTRGYSFDPMKLGKYISRIKIDVTIGQLLFEIRHLKRKLRLRSQRDYRRLLQVKAPEVHPLFRVIEGEVEEWEKDRSANF